MERSYPSEQYVQALRAQLHELRDQWPSHQEFWQFIGTHAQIATRGAYNFAAHSANARNPRLTTIRGIEAAIHAAKKLLRRRTSIPTR